MTATLADERKCQRSTIGQKNEGYLGCRWFNRQCSFLPISNISMHAFFLPKETGVA